LSTNETSLFMTAYSAWVTWREDKSGLDPFGFKKNVNASKVRSCCGLDPQRRHDGKPLMLLVYHADGKVELYRPTIADAGLHELFQPPLPPEHRHGWTQTWPREVAIPNFRPIARPEAVHERQTLSLIEPSLTRQLN